MRKQCPYSELFSPYSVRTRENANQNNSEYGHFSRNDNLNPIQDGGGGNPPTSFSHITSTNVGIGP